MLGQIMIMRAIEVFRSQSDYTECNFERSRNRAFRRPKSVRRSVTNKTNLFLFCTKKNKFRKYNIKTRLQKKLWNYKTKNNALKKPPDRLSPWLKWKNRKISPEQLRIQEVDGAFFEKFGSLLREQSELAKKQEQQEHLRVAEEAALLLPELTDEDDNDDDKNEENDELIQARKISDSSAVPFDSESTTPSDSEVEELDKSDFFSTALNIDELYTEILYEILHNVGCDVNCEVGQTALFSYAQEAFKMSSENHKELMQAAEDKEPPEILLNVEIVEAKDLLPKDSNGLSDPFVTLYLASNASRRYNTSVKPETLSPMWEEHFALPVNDRTIEDHLCLEVWDFDPAETVGEKFGKFFHVKGVKGARKLLKEIAVTATMGQHENELIGTTKIPLKTIPANGLTMWYGLEKRNKGARRGVIKVRLTFGSEKNNQVAAQEHKHLLRILLLHELESYQVKPHCWNGVFGPQAEALITQHSIQSGLSLTEVALAQFAVYAGVHTNHALNFSVFSALLDQLIKPIQGSLLTEEDVKIFWNAVKKLLPSCYSTVRKIRKKTCEKQSLKQLLESLKILAKVSTLDLPTDLDVFPSEIYQWISYRDDGSKMNIMGVLNDAVTHSANDWFNFILENNSKRGENEEAILEYLLKIIQLIRSDLQKAIEYYDKLFQEVANFQYAKTLYVMYQVKISTLVEPDILTVCKSLKKISYNWNEISQDTTAEPLLLGTKLFELYLALQRFVVLGKGLCPLDCDSFHIRNFHKWFHGGVAQWLDIAVYKALQRIEKAVDLDNLSPVDETIKFSSSALDTLTIFHQIKTFWEELNWPDVEGSYAFIAKIIDDICRCCVFYADKMATRVEGMGDIKNNYEKRFEVTKEWCLAINNIDYVCQSLKPFTEELQLENILKKLADLRSPLEAQRCRDTLHTVIENSVDTVYNKIIELLEIVATKMSPAMKRLLVEGAELLHQDSNSIDRVMMYLDNNLATLHCYLNDDNFNRILDLIWDNLGSILSELIHSNIEKRRPPSFFANLRETLRLMVKCFKKSDESAECEALMKVEHLLEINGMETAQLIHQVHVDRWQEQNDIKNSRFGELTVRLKFNNNDILIEVINGRSLLAMDSNGACDSYVRINILPEEKFTTVAKPKTQTHNKNQFPLYDETFTLNLTAEQKKVSNGLINFVVKDKDFLGMSNQLIGEAYINFSEIPTTSEPLSSLPQKRLVLHRPTTLVTDAIRALETRQGDKYAKDFVKKYKQKLSSN